MADGPSGAEIKESLIVKNFGMEGKCIGQTSGANQAALSGLVAGANGCDSEAHFAEMYNLLVEIRTTLVNNGMMKGSA